MTDTPQFALGYSAALEAAAKWLRREGKDGETLCMSCFDALALAMRG